jgi:hypothetical protein
LYGVERAKLYYLRICLAFMSEIVKSAAVQVLAVITNQLLTDRQ